MSFVVGANSPAHTASENLADFGFLSDHAKFNSMTVTTGKTKPKSVKGGGGRSVPLLFLDTSTGSPFDFFISQDIREHM